MLPGHVDDERRECKVEDQLRRSQEATTTTTGNGDAGRVGQDRGRGCSLQAAQPAHGLQRVLAVLALRHGDPALPGPKQARAAILAAATMGLPRGRRSRTSRAEPRSPRNFSVARTIAPLELIPGSEPDPKSTTSTGGDAIRTCTSRAEANHDLPQHRQDDRLLASPGTHPSRRLRRCDGRQIGTSRSAFSFSLMPRRNGPLGWMKVRPT